MAGVGPGSFLTVMKRMGQVTSPGLMSFPQPGLTLCFDIPVRTRVLKSLDEIDNFVIDHGGRVYIAKDARMSSAAFEAYYPLWRKFAESVDPAFCSDFWRRVTGG